MESSFTVAHCAGFPLGPTARTEMRTSLFTHSATGISLVKGPGAGDGMGYGFAVLAHSSGENGLTLGPTRTSRDRTLRSGFPSVVRSGRVNSTRILSPYSMAFTYGTGWGMSRRGGRTGPMEPQPVRKIAAQSRAHQHRLKSVPPCARFKVAQASACGFCGAFIG